MQVDLACRKIEGACQVLRTTIQDFILSELSLNPNPDW